MGEGSFRPARTAKVSKLYPGSRQSLDVQKAGDKPVGGLQCRRYTRESCAGHQSPRHPDAFRA